MTFSRDITRDIANDVIIDITGPSVGDGDGEPVTIPTFLTRMETLTSVNAATITVTKPLGVETGDLLIAHIATGNGSNNTITPPAGWSTVFTDSSGTGTFHVSAGVFFRISNGAEGADFTFNFSMDSRGAASVYKVRDVNQSSPIGVFSQDAQPDVDTTIGMPSITTTEDKSLILYFAFTSNNSRNSSVEPTTPSKIFENHLVSPTSSDIGWTIAYQLDADVATTTASETVTLSAANGNAGAQIQIRGATS